MQWHWLRTTASSALFMSSAPMPGAPLIMPSFDRRLTPLAPIGPSWPVDDTMTLHSRTCARVPCRVCQTARAQQLPSCMMGLTIRKFHAFSRTLRLKPQSMQC